MLFIPLIMESLELIKKRRIAVGATQKELSDLSGVSQSMIAKIEAGRAEASYSIAKRIFEALDSMAHSHDPRVKDFMVKKVLFCNVGDKVGDVVKKMKKGGISQLPVLDGKELVGLISESVLVDNMDRLSSLTKVNEIMNDAPPVISEETSYKTTVSLLKEFSFVLVKGKKGFVGLVTKSDILGARLSF